MDEERLSAETPSSRTAACALRPRTVPTNVSAPPCATTTSKAGRLHDQARVPAVVGLERRTSRGRRPPRRARPEDHLRRRGAAVARMAAIACSAATMPALMSTEPHPWTSPSATTPPNGVLAPGALAGATTSRRPFRHSRLGSAPGQRHARADQLGARAFSPG